jgi:Ca2+-binding RTX toxin-like protein
MSNPEHHDGNPMQPLAEDELNALSGGGGATDLLLGRDGNDILVSNDGNDFFPGGDGNDVVVATRTRG